MRILSKVKNVYLPFFAISPFSCVVVVTLSTDPASSFDGVTSPFCLEWLVSFAISLFGVHISELSGKHSFVSDVVVDWLVVGFSSENRWNWDDYIILI